MSDPLLEARSVENHQRRNDALQRMVQTGHEVARYYWDLSGFNPETTSHLLRTRESGDMALYLVELGTARILLRQANANDTATDQ